MGKKTISFVRNIYTLSNRADLFKKEVLKSKELTALYFGEVKTYGLEKDPHFQGIVWKGFTADQVATHLSQFRTHPIEFLVPDPLGSVWNAKVFLLPKGEENTNKEICKCD